MHDCLEFENYKSYACFVVQCNGIVKPLRVPLFTKEDHHLGPDCKISSFGWPLNDSHAKPILISRNVSLMYHLAALPPLENDHRLAAAMASSTPPAVILQ